jgi:hypothetical protein
MISLTATSGAVAQKERLALSLSATTTGSAGDTTIASTAAKVRLKAGKQIKLNLSAKKLSDSVPAGTYHVLVSVTDPDGSKTTVDTGKTLVVQAPPRPRHSAN